jgi:hypothetical protein
MQLNGCQAPDFCVDNLVGADGEYCPVQLCPIHCTGTEIMLESEVDANGCPLEYRCVEPMTFTIWANDGECVATAKDPISLLPCGPGTQQQTRTCKDGTIEKCADAIEEPLTKSVTCELTKCTEAPKAPATDCFANDQDSYGNDVKEHKGIASAAACQELCNSNADCNYFTYGSTIHSGNCWLKSKKATTLTAKTGLISGPKTCVAGECTAADSVDFCGPCQNNAQCKATHFCCPLKKLCVKGGCSDCPLAVDAGCTTGCPESKDQSTCVCTNPDFPWATPCPAA